MKRILSIFLVLVLAIGCFAGCGEDEKKNKEDNNISETNNPDDNSKTTITIEDISETVSKLKEGATVEVKLTVGIKPVFNEYVTEENFVAETNGLFNKNSNGLYELPLVISGIASEENASVALKFANKEVTDLIVAEEKVYINIKDFFDFFMTFAGVQMSYPCTNEYIELLSFVQYIQSLESQYEDMDDEFVGFYDDEIAFLAEPLCQDTKSEQMQGANGMNSILFGGINQETVEDLKAIIEALSTAIPETTLQALTTKIVEILNENKAIIVQEDHVSFKLDKTNIKPLVIAIADLVRTNGVDVIDYCVKAIQNSDKIDENIKEDLLEGYDKELLKKEIEEELKADVISQDLDELLAIIGDTHFYVTIGATDTSANIVVDCLVEDTSVAADVDTTSDISKMSVNFELKCEMKDSVDIKAPTNVLGEDEINTLLVFVSALG